MTEREAIEKFKFIANSDAPCPRYCMLPCDKCVQESEQLAEWLEELKVYQQHKILCNRGYDAGYNKAIDDLIAECENAKFAESDEISLSDVHTGVNSGLSMAIHFAEQLKAGGENGKERS